MSVNLESNPQVEPLQNDAQTSIWPIALLTTVIFIVLGVILLFKRGGKKPPIVKNKGNAVFIMGECGAGKTSLLYKLAGGVENVKTVSSIEPTESIIEINLQDEKTKKVSFIDVPGHNYTKLKYISELGSARGVLFLIDNQNIYFIREDFVLRNSFGSAAEYLYTIMIQRVFQEKQIPILICGNKNDLTKVNSLEDFKHLLVREVEKIKRSRRAIQEEENDQIDDYIQVIFYKLTSFANYFVSLALRSRVFIFRYNILVLLNKCTSELAYRHLRIPIEYF